MTGIGAMTGATLREGRSAAKAEPAMVVAASAAPNVPSFIMSPE